VSTVSRSLSAALVSGLVALGALPAGAQTPATPPPAQGAASQKPGTTSSKTAGAGELTRAYKREFAFLEAESNAIKQRIAKVQAEHPARSAAARTEVEDLQARATSLSLESDRLEGLLADTQRAADATLEDDDALSSLLQQANVAITAGGRKLPEVSKDDPEAETKQLDAAFALAIEILNEQASVRVTDGTYFARDGRQVKGPIVQVGNIARFGAAQGAAGALVPAGEGAMKLWPNGDSSATAFALAQGKAPPVLQMFVFDSVDKAVEPRKDKTVDDIMIAGGVIGWVIVYIGALVLFLLLWRVVALARRSVSGRAFVAEIAGLTARNEIAAAVALAGRKKHPMGRILHALLTNLERPREELEDVLSEAMLKETPAIDRFGSAIPVMASVSPLLGLLGTVTGMIATFDVITEYGTSNPKLLSGGISEALVTTEFGLMVAIPALLFGNVLASWGESIKDDLEQGALHITNLATGVHVAGLEPATASARSQAVSTPAEAAAS
jgi:biopolymer transport protein ExbB